MGSEFYMNKTITVCSLRSFCLSKHKMQKYIKSAGFFMDILFQTMRGVSY